MPGISWEPRETTVQVKNKVQLQMINTRLIVISTPEAGSGWEHNREDFTLLD